MRTWSLDPFSASNQSTCCSTGQRPLLHFRPTDIHLSNWLTPTEASPEHNSKPAGSMEASMEDLAGSLAASPRAHLLTAAYNPIKSARQAASSGVVRTRRRKSAQSLACI